MEQPITGERTVLVYELTPRFVGEWDERIVYSFQKGTDGNSPISNVVFDAAGNVYGTTSEGGSGSGAMFKLTPVGGGQWIESIIHPFEGPPDGAFPCTGMVPHAGQFYGATVHGGDGDDGAIYEFVPN